MLNAIESSKSIPRRRVARGYTLVEILLVMGIIIMVITLVLLSVNAMLRGSKMARAVNLIVAAIDEARTAALTIRRTTRIDVTLLDENGKLSRMTTFGTGVGDSFEQYKLPIPSSSPTADPTQDPLLATNWNSTGKAPQLVSDGSRCLKIRGLTSPGIYWNAGLRVDAISLGDYYEAILFARIKILPGTQRAQGRTMTVGILGSIDDNNGSSVKSSYRMAMQIKPSGTSGANDSSTIQLERFSGGSGQLIQAGGDKDGPSSVVFDKKNGTSAPTALLVEGVWYRMMLSVKSYTPDDGKDQRKAIISGKVWADGQLEPLTYTVGPITETSGDALSNGFGGFSVDGCDAVVDDVLFDMRPIRLIPPGITFTPLDPDKLPNAADLNSKYNFPLMFRPDGTTSVFSIIEIADSTTGDKKYVRIDQNTGRARVKSTLDEVKK